MKRKKVLISATIAFFLVIVGSIYYLKPAEFLSEEALIEAINSHYDSVEVQEVIFLGEKHVFVPFTSNGHYGTSYWIWKKGKWQLGEINTIQQPYIWKVNPEDPSTYVVTWNMAPHDELAKFDVYLLNRRGYSVIDGVQRYIPQVQLPYTIAMDAEKNTFGVKPIPAEWVTFLDSYVKVENSKQPDSFFSDFFQPSSFYFGWVPYDESGEESRPLFPNGSGHGYGNIHLEFLSSIPEDELE